LLDFGCGTAGLNDYLIKYKYNPIIKYSGLDISRKFVEISRRKFPNNDFYCVDILAETFSLPRFDYVILNGVFTVKRNLTFEEMFEFMKDIILKIAAFSDVGFAYNVMSKQVDWERSDLFHLPLDVHADFLTKHVTRNYIIRNDYGLYEYTVYVYP
jgi:SAM-dependent methyltransferase